MRYWLKVFKQFVCYADLYFLALVLSNGLVFVFMETIGWQGIFEVATSGSGKVMGAMFCLLGLNLFIWSQFVWCFSEAEDDVFLSSNQAPPTKFRSLGIKAFSILSGVPLCNATMWSLTNDNVFLWKPMEYILLSLGNVLSIVVSILLTYALSARFSRKIRIRKPKKKIQQNN